MWKYDFLEKFVRVLLDLRLGQMFLELTPEAQSIKGKKMINYDIELKTSFGEVL